MRIRRKIILSLVVLCLAVAGEAQTKRRSTKTTTTKKPVVVTPAPTPSSTAAEPVVDKPEPKKNERPAASNGAKTDAIAQVAGEPAYYYQFEQPNFDISKIVIEHDEAGKGTITFTKRMFNETETDPLQVSTAAMDRINAIYTALNFMESSENYQYEKNYSHLGTMTFRLNVIVPRCE